MTKVIFMLGNVVSYNTETQHGLLQHLESGELLRFAASGVKTNMRVVFTARQDYGDTRAYALGVCCAATAFQRFAASVSID